VGHQPRAAGPTVRGGRRSRPLVHDDDNKLQEIERRATEQGKWIDDNMPEHPLSTRSAAGRQNRTVYESAKGFAANLRLRLKSSTLTS
jgi:hypothetical protein